MAWLHHAYAGPDGDGLMKEVHVAEERKGRWRVEEEFVNAIRGEETVTRTDFTSGVAPCSLALKRCCNVHREVISLALAAH